MTTVIGRFDDLRKFNDDPNIDTWLKSGRTSGTENGPVTWLENRAWLDARIERGDSFAIATDPATLPEVAGGYVPGKPNGYFTARELRYLQELGINVVRLS